jgi:hypothetical protein
MDLYPLTRNSRFAQISTSPRKRGEVKKAGSLIFTKPHAPLPAPPLPLAGRDEQSSL